MPDVAGKASSAHAGRSLPQPMLAMAGKIPSDDSGYAFEFKWDGIRALAELSSSGVRLWSRNGNEVTSWFPELQAMSQALRSDSRKMKGTRTGKSPAPRRKPRRAQTLLLDGEIVALDAKGRPSFPMLQRRLGVTRATDASRLAASHPVHFMAFDILRVEGRPIMSRPYSQRRRLLEGLALAGPSWGTSPAHIAAGSVMLAMSQRLGLEGIMAKRLDAPYRPGRRTPAWIKVRNRMRQEFVVGGWTEGEGSRDGSVGSLLLGYHPRPGPGDLRYVGKVGSGLGGHVLKSLALDLRRLAAPSPFEAGADLPRGAHMVQPRLVAEVEFSEVTPSGNLRQPSFKGLRLDKDPRDVVWEQVVAAPHEAPGGQPSPRPNGGLEPRRPRHRRMPKDKGGPATRPKAPGRAVARRRGLPSRGRG